jgi:cytoskeletal protein CcmA (bactofilin family)
MFGLKRRLHDAADGQPTYIAPSAKFVGTIAGRGAYVCCGTFEGDCDIDGLLTLADGGRWKGTITATDIVVGGIVEGDVVARQRLEVAPTARIAGTLSGKSIAVAEGAIIEGAIKVTSGQEPVKFQEKRQTPAEAG